MIHRSARHRRFAGRLLEAMGLTSFLGLAACTAQVAGGGTGGTGGAGGAGNAGSTGVGPQDDGGSNAFPCDVPPYGNLGGKATAVLVCLIGQGEGCPTMDGPVLIDLLAKQLGVCADPPTAAPDGGGFPPAPCCDQKAVTGTLCGPGPTGCCYYANVVDFGSCGNGRPFTVAGVARTAPARSRADWSATAAPRLAELDAPTRRALAEAWERDARYEHASVASFARLALELLAVGAPAELVRDAQRAMGDEIRHAELCFALAGAYAGAPLGPGPIPIEGALGRASLAAMAAAAVREGCIGETIAALAAQEAREGARDPAARAVLDGIADDEAAHAAMSWRLAAWAFRSGSAEVRDAIAAAFAAPVEAGIEAVPAGIDEVAYRAHGRLMPEDLRELTARALAEVVRPSAAALLASWVS